MGKMNTSGEAIEIKDSPVLEHEERYEMEFLESDVKEVEKIDWSSGVPKKTGTKENKILIQWIHETNPYPMFLNPSVTRGSTVTKDGATKTYDNSKMFDTMDKLGILADWEKLNEGKEEFEDSELSNFLNEKLSGKKALVEVKNSKGENPKTSVSKVIKVA